jgi:DNA-binding NarL/FixJ family response regulator
LARILVADDQDLVLNAICRLIEKAGEGWRVCARATNGQQAVELALSEKPDLAILDLRMPVLDGISAGKEIRARLPDTPVLIFTAVDVPRLGLIVKEAGLQGAIQKADGNALVPEIRKVLSRTRTTVASKPPAANSRKRRKRGTV